MKINYAIANNFLRIHSFPDLSEEEKRKIDDYWRNYGIKFPDYSWFKMYYGVTGIHDPKFIPNDIVHQILVPYYNNLSCISGWDDKNIYEVLLPSTKFPDTLAHCVNGRFYDSQWNSYSNDNESISKLSERIYDELGQDKSIIFKEARGSFAGKGVRLYKVSGISDVKDLLASKPSKNYILQKRIAQHPFFSQFCKTSVNIVRIITWRKDDDVKVLMSCIRYGTEGSFTDVSYVGGKEIVNVAGLSSEGEVTDNFVNFDGKGEGFALENKQVPCWEEMLATVKAAAKRMLHFDIVGWDFTINDKNEIICIEYNIHWPGTILYQYACGPIAGDNTDDMLSFLLRNEGRKTIPKLFKTKK